MNSKTESKFKELLQFARKNGLSEIAWQEGNRKIAFRRRGDDHKSPVVMVQEEPVAVVAAPEQEENYVRSPIVGIFKRSKYSNRPPFVLDGDHIKQGDRLAVVECMKIPTEVISFCQGQISKILVDDGQAVEYGQPLFRVTPPNGNSNYKRK
jgi:acetyl-CoA carboxylase biotin carboxyl carrier protein